MGTMWVRLPADGFDPHIHNNLMGDAPATAAALAQIPSYKVGRNGLANNNLDRNPYRKKPYHDYIYIEEEDMTPAQAKQLAHIENMLERSLTQDARARDREKQRFTRLVTLLGKQADDLGRLIDMSQDDATKTQLKRMKEKILLQLKDDQDVTQEDNPSDDALAEENMG
jgi:hypothetical protein